MSSQLVKQSLSLFDDDLSSQSETVKKKKSTKSPMQLISSKKKGVKKELKKQKKQQLMKSQGRKKNTDHKQLDDSTGAVDYTDMSVQSLCRISKLNAANEAVAKVVFEHHSSRKSRQEKKQSKVKEDQLTAFSDKDFEDFAKEYDFSKVSKKK